MPELAEVEFARKVWNPGLGTIIQKVEAKVGSRVYRDLNPTTVKRNLRGATLESSETHGKKMLFRFSGDRWLGLHLGMTGGLFVENPDYLAGKHDALVLRQTKKSLVFRDPRQFGRILYHHGKEVPAWWSNLPPEVTSCLEGQSGEARFRWLHSRPGAAADLRAAAIGAFGQQAWIRTLHEVEAECWLGPRLGTAARSRLGDVALVARGQVAFRDPAEVMSIDLIGRHGSLTPDEVLVPAVGIVA